MEKAHYVIKRISDGTLMRGIDNHVLFFEYPIQADNYIKRQLGNSKKLEINKWVKKDVKR